MWGHSVLIQKLLSMTICGAIYICQINQWSHKLTHGVFCKSNYRPTVKRGNVFRNPLWSNRSMSRFHWLDILVGASSKASQTRSRDIHTSATCTVGIIPELIAIAVTNTSGWAVNVLTNKSVSTTVGHVHLTCLVITGFYNKKDVHYIQMVCKQWLQDFHCQKRNS